MHNLPEEKVHNTYGWNTNKLKDGDFSWEVYGFTYGSPREILDKGVEKSRAIAISKAKKGVMKYRLRENGGDILQDRKLDKESKLYLCKKPNPESLKEDQIEEISADKKQSYIDAAKKQVSDLDPWTKKGEYKDIAKRMIDRRNKGIERHKRMEEKMNFDKSNSIINHPEAEEFAKEYRDAKMNDYNINSQFNSEKSKKFNDKYNEVKKGNLLHFINKKTKESFIVNVISKTSGTEHFIVKESNETI